MVLAEWCLVDVASIFFGGRLIALNKKSGGISPIAVGFTLQRLVSKCANTHATACLSTFFRPIQLGVGTPGGCEAVIHAAHQFLETMSTFNYIHRSDKLKSIADCVPELLPYCHSAYANPSVHYNVTRGPQQRDPLSPPHCAVD